MNFKIQNLCIQLFSGKNSYQNNLNNLNIDYCNFIELDKRFDEYNNTNSNLQDKRIKENILKSKIDKIAKIYGTESEEYKKLEIELKSI